MIRYIFCTYWQNGPQCYMGEGDKYLVLKFDNMDETQFPLAQEPLLICAGVNDSLCV